MPGAILVHFVLAQVTVLAHPLIAVLCLQAVLQPVVGFIVVRADQVGMGIDQVAIRDGAPEQFFRRTHLPEHP